MNGSSGLGMRAGGRAYRSTRTLKPPTSMRLTSKGMAFGSISEPSSRQILPAVRAIRRYAARFFRGSGNTKPSTYAM